MTNLNDKNKEDHAATLLLLQVKGHSRGNARTSQTTTNELREKEKP